jgi:hypothetical protein
MKPDHEATLLRPRSRRDAADRRVRLIGIGVSTVVHAGLILLYALNGQGWSALAGRVSVDAPEASSMEGTQLVNLVEIEPPEPSAEAPAEDVEEEDDDEEDVPMVIVALEPSGGAPDNTPSVAPDPIPAASVFRIRITDPSLWIVARPDLILLTPAQRMQLELQGRLEAWNDSLNAAIAAETARLDWTKSDGKGGRWGISPGKLHLGNITIPLPFGFGPDPWQAELIAKRAAREDDIINHVQAQAVRASWKERAEAIRRRKDRERERARERRGGSDTTRARGGGL